MKSNKKKYSLFYPFFFLRENVLTFLSGIFISSSINILTSQIPNSVFNAGFHFFLVAVFLFSISVLFIIWSGIIKRAFFDYENYYSENRDNTESKSAQKKNEKWNKRIIWYECLEKNQLCIPMIIISFLIVVLFIGSALLLIICE